MVIRARYLVLSYPLACSCHQPLKLAISGRQILQEIGPVTFPYPHPTLRASGHCIAPGYGSAEGVTLRTQELAEYQARL
jgi:hypothetical protein